MRTSPLQIEAGRNEMVDYTLIPEKVRDLLRERVHAIEHIEILLYLRAEAPRAHAVSAMVAQLRIAETFVAPALEHLVRCELIAAQSEPSGFRYAPATVALDEAVAALATCHADSRVELLRLVSSNAMERLRSGSLTIFAEAFRLRRKKKDG